MIEGGWSFIYAAYAMTALGLGGLVLVTFLRARAWAKRARALDQRR